VADTDVETVRSVIDAWNQGDLDAFLAKVHPDGEWRPVLAVGVEGSTAGYRGHDEIRHFWHEFHEMFDQFSVEIQEACVVGRSVLVLGHIHGRAHSGVPIDTPYAAVFEMRDGKCFATSEFLSHGRALEAVGLGG
jgi:ketosteroid isomerase-like protein